ERCRAGVTVNVLLDAVGALALPTEYRDIMTNAGCRVESFRPLSPFAIDKVNNRNHRRILVVDGRMGITGGSGTSGKWGGAVETVVRTARNRGRVVLLLPGAIDHNIVKQASRAELGRLLEAGVEVYEYRAALLHAKTMVVDSRWATVGSTNLDRRSFALNDE